MKAVIITWACRAIAGLFAAGCAIWGAIAARESWHRAGKIIEDARSDVGDDTLAVTCDPCHGKPGRCTCTSRCGHPDCVGDHTSFTRREAAELEQLLGRKGKSR